MLKIVDINKRFKDKVVLQGVTLDIPANQTFVILGPSGCGKSVLLKIIIGLIPPDGGRIEFEDRRITGLGEEELIPIRRQIAMLFQNGALFDSLTVAENIAFPLRRHQKLDESQIQAIIRQNLDWVGLGAVEHLYPDELSGGMRKRVALARAIALDPRLILFDEPTTGLDPIMVTVIDDLNLRLKREFNMTSIVVTHDIVSAFRIADHMAVLYNGKIRAVGTPEAIRSSEDPLVQQFIQGKIEGPIQLVKGSTE